MASETLISVASTTDSERAVQSAANCEQPSDDPVGACSVETAVVDESPDQDTTIISVEHPKSERALLQERLFAEQTEALSFAQQVAAQDQDQEEAQSLAEPQPQPQGPQAFVSPSREFDQRLGQLAII